MAGLSDFALDFGISISTDTLKAVGSLSAGLATGLGIMKACAVAGDEIAMSMKKSALAAGGYAQAIQNSRDAMKRLLSGETFFDTKDQIQGMELLRQKGIDLQKNFEFINKSAHATGKTFTEFSSMVSSAIAGNSHALVEAGLMTERSARMFDKYQANTVQRQQAILNFLKAHKGLTKMINEDFHTIGEYLDRIPTAFEVLKKAIVGDPNDPESLYASCVKMAKTISDYFIGVIDKLKKHFWGIGQVLAWYVRQVTHFIDWVGRKLKPHLDSLLGVSENYKEQVRSFIVWLEFWKVKLVSFMREYKKEIMIAVGVFMLLKGATHAWLELGSYGRGKALSWVADIAKAGWRLVASNPYVAIVVAIIAILVVLYNKFKEVRIFINGFVKMMLEWVKMIGNLASIIVQGIIIAVGFLVTKLGEALSWLWDNLTDNFVINTLKDGFIELWDAIKPGFEWLANALSSIWEWLGDSWLGGKIKAFGKMISDNIIEPLRNFFSGDWWNKITDFFGGGLSGINDRLASANKSMGQLIVTGSTDGNNETVNKIFGNLEGSFVKGQRDDTNYLSKGYGAIKKSASSAISRASGDTNTVNIYNENKFNFEGGMPSDEELDKLTYKITETQKKNDNQVKLQLGK